MQQFWSFEKLKKNLVTTAILDGGWVVDTILQELPRTIPVYFGLKWLSGFTRRFSNYFFVKIRLICTFLAKIIKTHISEKYVTYVIIMNVVFKFEHIWWDSVV